MLKKILLGTLLVGFMGVLIFGAIYRTNAIGSKETSLLEGNTRQAPSPAGNQAEGSNTSYGSSRGWGNQGNGGQMTDTDPGSGQAVTKDWITVEGTVTNLEAGMLTISTENGGTLEIADQPWRFAQEQGFTTDVSHRIAVTGFYEDGQEFEVGHITDLSTGESVALREENGRPLWAGRGRGG